MEYRVSQIRSDIRNFSGFVKKPTKPEDLMPKKRRELKQQKSSGVDPLWARLNNYSPTTRSLKRQ